MNTDTYWREIFRYLGYKNGARPEGGTLRMIERAEADIRAAAEPKHAKRYFALSFLDKGAVQIASDFGLNEYVSKIISGVILFFILGSEFFINYQVKTGAKHK